MFTFVKLQCFYYCTELIVYTHYKFKLIAKPIVSNSSGCPRLPTTGTNLIGGNHVTCKVFRHGQGYRIIYYNRV